jgi:hypothetical protein
MLNDNKKAGQKACYAEAVSSGLVMLILWHLRRCLAGRPHHIIHDPSKIFEAGRWDNDGVAASVHIFGDAKESSARILLQGEKESLPLDLHFVAAQRILDHRGLV